MDCPFDLRPRTVFVFSHPNHEVAVWGLLRELRPAVVFLTDGGGGERLAQTKNAMTELRLCGVYLNRPEADVYGAFLKNDYGFFGALMAEVRDVFREVKPERIFTDAVEQYNPINDLALPLAVCAARQAAESSCPVPFYEVPLVYQKNVDPEAYACQSVPPERAGWAVRWRLSSAEKESKMQAWNRRYTLLAKQMAPIMADVTAIAAHETVMVAHSPMPEPPPSVRLRYESVEESVSRERHYIPVARRLCEEC